MLICQQMGPVSQRHKVRHQAWGKVVLHVTGFGTNGATSFPDLSRYGRTVTTNGNTQISNTVTLLDGRTWVYFDGTGDFLTVPTSTDFDMASSTWRLRMWIYPTRAGAAQYLFARRDDTTAGTHPLGILQITTANKLQFFQSNAGGATLTDITHNTALSLNTAYFVEVIRVSTGNVRILLDGINNCTVGTDTASAYPSWADKLSLGSDGQGSGVFYQGYVADAGLQIGGVSDNDPTNRKRPTLPWPRY